jgi:hypothetical protein
MWLTLTLAAAVCLLGGLVAASSASAFTGEPSVIKPGGGDLTEAAKTIIERPTFLPENVGEAGASGGSAEASGAAGVFEASGLLPALSSVVGFGVGTVIGSEICHVVGIEGCWYFGSKGADPATGGGGTWQATGKESLPVGTYVIPAYTYYWHTSGGANSIPLEGLSSKECPTLKTPGGTDATHLAEHVAWYCGSSSERKASDLYTSTRNFMTNREIKYDPKDEAGIANYAEGKYEAPAEWSKNFAKAIEGHTGDPAARVGERVAAEIKGSGVKNPYATVKVPDCAGLKKAPCQALVEELKLTPKVTELDWEDAVIEELDTLEPEKSREEESERVITVVPAPGEFVVPGTDIKIETNPAKEDMPEFLPKPDKEGGEDGEGEDEDEYKKRLAPIFIPGVDELSDATLDPEVGPGRVSHTVPGPSHRFNPATEHDVEVAVNPATAPLVGGGGGGGCEASVGAINWNPLNQPLGSRFPFGVFAFFVAWIGEWTASEVAPEWKVTVLPPMLGGEGLKITIDLASMAPVAEVVRIAFIFVSFVGLLWFLGTAAMKIQGDNS